MFRKTTNREVEVYSDANWVGSILVRRITFGYCSFVWENLVTWRSKKQFVVSRSSVETEFRDMAQEFCEGTWLRRLLQDLKMNVARPVNVLCDNQSAISIVKNLVHHDLTKFIKIDEHFIKETLEEGIFQLIYIPTNNQVVDILTKALPRKIFEDLRCKLDLNNIFSLA